MLSKKHSPSSNNQWAIVTGASSGIGLHYATLLAQSGWNIVAVSNQEQQLNSLVSDLSQKFNIKTRCLYIDLSKSDSADNLFNFCDDISVKILINNAGIFSFEQLNNTPKERIELYIGLHIETTTKLCQMFSSKMTLNGGYILNMGSLACYMNMPGITMYQSTKAYIRAFSRAMWYEMRQYGVSITVISPGGVDTNLYGLDPKLRKLGVKLGILIPAEKLAQKALKAMFNRRRELIPGFINRLFIPIIHILPVWIIMFIKTKLSKYEKK